MEESCSVYTSYVLSYHKIIAQQLGRICTHIPPLLGFYDRHGQRVRAVTLVLAVHFRLGGGAEAPTDREMQIVCRLTNHVSPARKPFIATSDWNVYLQQVQEGLYTAADQRMAQENVAGMWVKPVPRSPERGGGGFEREARKEQGRGMDKNIGRSPASYTPRVLHAVPTSARFSHLLFCGLKSSTAWPRIATAVCESQPCMLCARSPLLCDVLVCSLFVWQEARGGAEQR
jgi:hypothetical protein